MNGCFKNRKLGRGDKTVACPICFPQTKVKDKGKQDWKNTNKNHWVTKLIKSTNILSKGYNQMLWVYKDRTGTYEWPWENGTLFSTPLLLQSLPQKGADMVNGSQDEMKGILGKTESCPYVGHTHAKDETQVTQMLKRTLIHKAKVFMESTVTSRTRTSQILSILLYSLSLMLYPRQTSPQIQHCPSTAS